MRKALLATAALLIACACTACGSSGKAGPGVAASRPTFVRGITNPWFPLKPGTTFVYTGEKDGKKGRDIVRVTSRTRTIRGAPCTAVDDRLYLNGRLAERTTDWYTQDSAGNVWYFGEATGELSRTGKVTSREGSWLAGVHGAEPGIFMTAHPKLGRSYRQEYYRGQAEDHFEVVRLSASVLVPYTASAHALLTKEWTPLEPGTLDHKLYIRGVGLAKEETIRGGNELWELADVLHK